MAKLLLLTGASGNLGRWLTPKLAEAGYRLRLTDIAAFPDPLPEGAAFTAADLADAAAVSTLVQGCDRILHIGGISIERPWEEILGANIIGTVNIFEAARHEGQRLGSFWKPLSAKNCCSLAENANSAPQSRHVSVLS